MIVDFRYNEPKTLALANTEAYNFMDRYNLPRVRYTLVGGDCLFVDVPTSQRIRALELKAGETFGMCKGKDGRRNVWRVWLTPETEKARAAEEKPQVEAQLRDMVPILQASVAAVQRKRGQVIAMPSETPQVPGTGTYGAVP